MLKLLHLADLHLDSPFKNLSYIESVEQRQKQRGVFSAALDYASKQDCCAVLISGDLFDCEFYTTDTVSFLIKSFNDHPNIKFIITPGNHDPYRHGSPYTVVDFPENVYIFTDEDISDISFPELDLNIYGYAFTSNSYKKQPLEDFTAKQKGFNILCAHSDIDIPASEYAYISPSQIEDSRLDYIALGHIHTKPEIMKKGKTLYAYSGCIAGRDFSEYGEKGGILVTLSEMGGEKIVHAERVTFCLWEYVTENISIDGCASQQNAVEMIKSVIDEHTKAGLDRIISITLYGNINFTIDSAAITRALSELGVVETDVGACFLSDFGALEEDYSIRGEFYRQLKPLLLSDDADQRNTALRALRFGLNALNGADITLE